MNCYDEEEEGTVICPCCHGSGCPECGGDGEVPESRVGRWLGDEEETEE